MITTAVPSGPRHEPGETQVSYDVSYAAIRMERLA
jgi:hypothetical protein